MNAAGLPTASPDVGCGRIGHAFLIADGEVVAFHRLGECDETWLLVAGGPVEVHLIHPDGRHEVRIMSIDPATAGSPATLIEAGVLRAGRLVPGGRPALLHRSGGSGQRPVCAEFPRAADILRQHPLHRGIVLDLTAG